MENRILYFIDVYEKMLNEECAIDNEINTKITTKRNEEDEKIEKIWKEKTKLEEQARLDEKAIIDNEFSDIKSIIYNNTNLLQLTSDKILELKKRYQDLGIRGEYSDDEDDDCDYITRSDIKNIIENPDELDDRYDLLPDSHYKDIFEYSEETSKINEQISENDSEEAAKLDTPKLIVDLLNDSEIFKMISIVCLVISIILFPIVFIEPVLLVLFFLFLIPFVLFLIVKLVAKKKKKKRKTN